MSSPSKVVKKFKFNKQQVLNKPGYGRRGVKYPICFEEILPLALRDFVSGKGNRGKEVSCIPEMMSMFSCFQENEFNQSYCSKEVKQFQDCYVNHLKILKHKREHGTDQKLVPNLKVHQLTPFQVNKLLKKYPQPK